MFKTMMMTHLAQIQVPAPVQDLALILTQLILLWLTLSLTISL